MNQYDRAVIVDILGNPGSTFNQVAYRCVDIAPKQILEALVRLEGNCLRCVINGKYMITRAGYNAVQPKEVR